MTLPTDADLAAALDAMSGTRVLVLGDVMLDRWVIGNVDRVSPEAPIPILRVTEEREMVGGAGNVAANLHALGAVPVVLSVSGDDAAGGRIEGMLAGFGEASVLKDGGRPTSVKSRYVASGQQMLRSDRERTAPVEGAVEQDLIDRVHALLPSVAALVLSDYGKGVLTDRVVTEAIRSARDAGLPVVVDPKGRDYRRYSGASYVTPNRKELAEGSDMPTENDREVEAAAAALMTESGIEGVLATRSEQGMTLAAPGEPFRHIPTEALSVYDVSGAGDTVVAVLTAGLAAKATPLVSAILANVAGGIVVGKAGTATASAEEIRQRARLGLPGHPTAPVLRFPEDVSRLKDWVAGWRRDGHSVALTNGCFDILHPGHISLMQQAAAEGDRLIVAVNTDASVKRLKGPERPINAEGARAAVLSALADVDLVVTFGEDTPFDLISAVVPDVLIKGADWATVEQVVGHDVVQAAGGRVVLASLVEGESTTGTISRMRAAGR